MTAIRCRYYVALPTVRAAIEARTMTEGFVPFAGPSGLVRRPTSGGYVLYLRDAKDRPKQWGAVVVVRLREEAGTTVAVGEIWSPVELVSRILRLAFFVAVVAHTVSRWTEMRSSVAAWAACGVALVIALLSLRRRKDAAAVRGRLTSEFRELLLQVHDAVSGTHAAKDSGGAP